MTLTAVSIFTKRAIIAFVVLSILSLVSYITYKIWYESYLTSLPIPKEQPDAKFGILARPILPPSRASSSNFSYTLATQTGGLPEFTGLVKVYFVPRPGVTLLASDRAFEFARKFSINTQAEVISESHYKFTESDKTLDYFLDNSNFRFERTSTKAAEISADEQTLIRNFRNILDNLGTLPEALKESPAKVLGNQIFIWPADLDGKPVKGIDFEKSSIWAKISGDGATLDKYLSVNFIYWFVDPTTFSTYPLKKPEEAFEDLKTGKGSVLIEPQSSDVSITSVSIAYFQPEQYSPYLQPVYIFEGPSFIAYTQAILDAFLEGSL